MAARRSCTSLSDHARASASRLMAALIRDADVAAVAISCVRTLTAWIARAVRIRVTSPVLRVWMSGNRPNEVPAAAGLPSDSLIFCEETSSAPPPVTGARGRFLLVRGGIVWWPGAGSNRRPSDFQTGCSDPV